MRSISKYVFIVAFAVLFSSCASTPAFRMPPGSKVQVTQELSLPSGTRVSIQNGRVVPRRQIAAVQPFCQFYLYRSKEEMREPIVIRPDTFTVKRTVQRPDYAWAEGVQLAQIGRAARQLTTVMELSSDQQPEVRDLRCIVWGTVQLDGYLSINEMQATLGDLVKLIVEPE